MSKFDIEKLNKVNYSIRSSQALYQYGVGGLVDFHDQTLMTASANFWNKDTLKNISDERLAKTLHVDGFKMPGAEKNSTISYVRFPSWYFCPQCKRFRPIKLWQKEYKKKTNKEMYELDPYMVKHMKCPTCHQPLIVTRLVTVCKNGHIDDFPWVKFVHGYNENGKRPINECAEPELIFRSFGRTGSYAGLSVECKCGAHANLARVFEKDFFSDLQVTAGGLHNFKCNGRHPWKHSKEKCDCFPITQQRGGTAVYYPFNIKSLLIPPYSDELTRLIDESVQFGKMMERIRDDFEYEQDEEARKSIVIRTIDMFKNRIADEINKSVDEVEKVLLRKTSTEEEEIAADSIQYKAQEYRALTGNFDKSKKFSNDFVREETNISDYDIPFLKQVSLITKVKEVRVQTGFTRLNPVEKSEDGTDLSQIVDIRTGEMNWYPAYQVYGEGIFIEFDQDEIDKWIGNNPQIEKRISLINKNYRNSYGADSERVITPRFVLLHTISHLLIKQLSFECGYNIAALSERLYCSEKIDNMAGIFIYTSDGDSEGTLGGLIRQGRKDTLPRLFKKAIENAITCSNDPVCSLSKGQGRDSLNLSACYSCTMIPETSCEEFNCFLDRGVVVGTFDDRTLGFYSDYLFDKKEWKATSKSIEIKKPRKKLKFVDGIAVNQTYKGIWEYIEQFAEDEEIEILNKLKQDVRFNKFELPLADAYFTSAGTDEELACDLVWHNKKICLFTMANKIEYEIAQDSDYKCFFLLEVNIIEKLVNALGE